MNTIMIYQTLYTIAIVLMAFIITWCFIKIRKLKNEKNQLEIDIQILKGDLEYEKIQLKGIINRFNKISKKLKPNNQL